MEEMISFPSQIINVISYRCDDCNRGKMKYCENALITFNPILYTHKCSNCGKIQKLNDVYPITRKKAANDERRKCA